MGPVWWSGGVPLPVILGGSGDLVSREEVEFYCTLKGILIGGYDAYNKSPKQLLTKSPDPPSRV